MRRIFKVCGGFLFLESGSDLTSKRMVGWPGRFEGAFEVGEHEFRVLKRNVKERNLGL